MRVSTAALALAGASLVAPIAAADDTASMFAGIEDVLKDIDESMLDLDEEDGYQPPEMVKESFFFENFLDKKGTFERCAKAPPPPPPACDGDTSARVARYAGGRSPRTQPTRASGTGLNVRPLTLAHVSS
jgi:hypothetical protein